MPRPLLDERTKLLWQLGFFSPLDFVVVAFQGLGLLVIGCWKLFGVPSYSQLAFALGALLYVLLIWIAGLSFRCIWFVLQVMRDQQNLPAAAARVVLAYQRGGSMPPEKEAP